MATSADQLLLDTSAAIAYADPSHVAHEAVMAATASRRLGLAGHTAFETLSVLTRLPPPKRLSGKDALRLTTVNFPDSRFLDDASMPGLLSEFVSRGVVGGSVYDGLVGAASRAHKLPLLSCDVRARDTYEVLGVQYQMVG